MQKYYLNPILAMALMRRKNTNQRKNREYLSMNKVQMLHLIFMEKP